MDIFEADKIIQAARDFASLKMNEVSKKTAETYLRAFNRLVVNGKLPVNIENHSSFYLYRAALLHVSHKKTHILLEGISQLRKQARGEYLERAKFLKTITDIVEQYPPDPEQKRYQLATHAQREGRQLKGTKRDLQKLGPPTNSKRKKASKRNTLSKLKAGWREALWSATPDNHRSMMAVLALSGARPAELAKGVLVRRDGDQMYFLIQGAKLDKKRGKGQKERLLKVDPEGSPEGAWLMEKLASLGEVTITASARDCDNWVSRAWARAVKKKLPGTVKNERVSPYVLRHAFAARVKASGADVERIAEALGQQATKTQQEYGHAQMAQKSGGGRVTKVSATTPVRHTINRSTLARGGVIERVGGSRSVDDDFTI